MTNTTGPGVTSEPAFDHVYGKPFFDYLAEEPVLAGILNYVMTSASSEEGAAMPQLPTSPATGRSLTSAAGMARCWRKSDFHEGAAHAETRRRGGLKAQPLRAVQQRQEPAV
jgi:hypothetical protein